MTFAPLSAPPGARATCGTAARAAADGGGWTGACWQTRAWMRRCPGTTSTQGALEERLSWQTCMQLEPQPLFWSLLVAAGCRLYLSCATPKTRMK